MHVTRHHLIALLGRHCPADATEAEMLSRMVKFVEREERSLDAHLTEGHITASAWVVSRGDGSSVLLTHHRKLGKWFQLGGHLEPGETVLEGALREAREESGLPDVSALNTDIFDVDVHLIPERGAMPAHYHYDVRFLLDGPSDAPLITSSESRSLAWVRVEEAHRYNASESIQRMVRKSVYGNARA